MRPAVLHQRGLTLVELLVGVVLTGMAATIACQLLIAVERVTDAQGVRGELESTLRTAILVTRNELHQLAPGPPPASDLGGDILAISDTAISYRALRAYYVVCAAPSTATSIIVDRTAPSPFAAEIRAPTTSDSLLLFDDGDPTRTDDDRWLPLPITAVAADDRSCIHPWSGVPRPGYVLTLGTLGIAALGRSDGVHAGAPLRTFETATLRSYLSSGQRWLGLQIGPAAIEPIAGPLSTVAGAPGFALQYDDSVGRPLAPISASIPLIRGIRVTVRGMGQRPVASSGRARIPIGDSMSTYLFLRNASAP